MANVHWVVGGYFNLMTSLEEHKGGMCRMEEECETFIETIEELGLVDIIPREGWFTWNNKRMGDRHIASILDRFMVTKSIIELGSDINCVTLPSMVSYHWPVELMWSGMGSQFKKPFRFE